MNKKDFLGFLAGCICGDGNLRKQNNSKQVSFHETHSIKQKDYLLWKINILQKKFHYDLIKGYVEYEQYNKQTKKSYKFCRIDTRVNSKLKTAYKIFYVNKKKLFSKAALNLLTPLGLAVWYMDDGCCNGKMVYLSTYCSENECKIIQKYFRNKWNINWCIGKHNSHGKDYYILYRGSKSEDMNIFRSIIEPYIITSMRYKIAEIKPDARSKNNCIFCGKDVSNKIGGLCAHHFYLRYEKKLTSNDIVRHSL